MLIRERIDPHDSTEAMTRVRTCRWTDASVPRGLLTAAVVGMSSAACTEGAPSAPRAQVAPAQSADFFIAAVAYFNAGSDAPLRVDPRPLKAEARLHSVSESDILLTDSTTIRLRATALAAQGIPSADAAADWRCVFATGLRPPPGQGNDPIWEQMRAAEPDSLRKHREACRSNGEYVSLAFGPPQPGTQPDHPGRWRFRSMRMVLHGWVVVDLFLEPNPRGQWEVVDVEVRVGGFS